MPSLTKQDVPGWQIAFLIVAFYFLAAPADRFIFSQWQWARDLGLPIARIMMLVIAGAILVSIPALRRRCAQLLSVPVAPGKRLEVGLGVVLDVVTGFAAAGIVGLWIWSSAGEAGLARALGTQDKAAVQLAHALTLNGIVGHLLLAGLIAPIVEELLFRGLLYPAWASRWGWVRSALATSLLFAVLHPNMYAQFMASIVFICLLRRTGSLRAPIIAHAVFNILMWYPLLGQYVFPGARGATGEISYWTLQIVCLAIAVVALPLYMWMSRDEKAAHWHVTSDAAPARS